MLFDDLLEARIVQLRELGQVVYIGDDITEHLLKHQEVGIRGGWAGSPCALATGFDGAVQTGHDIGDLKFTILDAFDDLLALALLEQEDLLQLALEQRYKVRLIVLGPFFAGGIGVFGGGLDKIRLQRLLEIVIGNVEGIVLLDHRRPEIFTEPVAQLS